MPERPPPGYNRMDKPEPHNFQYKFNLNAEDETLNSTIMTFLRTSKDSADPKLIFANPLHGSFEVDGGPLMCYDSIIGRIMIDMDFTLTNLATQTDQVKALRIQYMPIFGAFEEWHSATDETTSLTPDTILELLKDATNEDVTPLFSTVNLGAGGNQPISTVTPAAGTDEVFGDYNLSVNLVIESVAFSMETLFDAFQFFTNGRLLSSHVGKMRSIVLTADNKPHAKVHLEGPPPRSVKRGNPFTFFGMLVHCEVDGNQLMPASDLTTGGGHIRCVTNVRFNEWNQHFDQSRMGG